MGKIQPVLLTLPKTSLLYKDISKTVAKFALEHVSMFNPPELIAQLRAYQSKVTVNERDDLSEPATYVTR
ncbi:unnamed protein product [Anisakis simplex]|uniref:Uncharacterized protein n=1 Tax=Anisakis simplex TaxID=6269 RepID=A0A0M3JPF4_ANISI|nr:unnamed protein product [Anisakis simplex]VDK38398.1 unnamed protein product [Anisakis simplex]